MLWSDRLFLGDVSHCCSGGMRSGHAQHRLKEKTQGHLRASARWQRVINLSQDAIAWVRLNMVATPEPPPPIFAKIWPPKIKLKICHKKGSYCIKSSVQWHKGISTENMAYGLQVHGIRTPTLCHMNRLIGDGGGLQKDERWVIALSQQLEVQPQNFRMVMAKAFSSG